jgi:leucyl aminopeptidase
VSDTTVALAASTALPRTDALVVATAPGPRGRGVELVGAPGALKPAARKKLLEALGSLGARGRTGETVKVAASGDVPVVLAVGLGDQPARGGYPAETLARSAGDAVRALAGTRRVALALPAGSEAEAEAALTGALLGAYSFTPFRARSAADQKAPVRAITLLVDDPKDAGLREVVARVRVVSAAVHLTRDLVNTPPSHLTPQGLAEAASAAVEGLPVEVEVLDEKALRAGGYGGITAVGQGSANPPRLIRLAYRPVGAVAHVAFVGKGITFDSGGISLKPAAGMEAMKSDMGGAAAVIAATAAVARLGLPVSVTAYAPTAENMPSGTAQRPSDVITIYGGRTVEVLNTDAEGRLILADALARAGEDEPDLIVDVATLTGAQQVALGNRISGVMSNADDVREEVVAAAGRAGEEMWPMPLPDDLRKGLDSSIADIANLGERWGGMLSAGIFLREFVQKGQRWAHIDIAGPSFNEGEAYGYTPKGGTGAAVRTLVQVARDAASKG